TLWLPPVNGPARPWTREDSLPADPHDFTFALLSDRTGLARAGVFERAVETLNWLYPDFVVQIGDGIEGYTTDESELAAQWTEFDKIVDGLERPLFRVVGNHDVSNPVMREDWLRRHGLLHYHFRYADTLFLVIDTCDPPQSLEEVAGDLTPERLAELHARVATDPDGVREEFEALGDWESTQPAAISEEQIAYFERVLAEHSDARWTFLCMHMPAWQGDGHPALERLYAALGERPFTAFAGHIHNYQRRIIRGRDHIRLGPTGGAWVRTGDIGNFDHVTLVRMTPEGPKIANLVLDGLLGVDGGTYPPSSTPPSTPKGRP
ncbi:MAG TPA: metallophosphoesterase, partial [Pseudonocardia sp.]|nr:metallophosphoesterase [Pseudonocardia sp.]